MGALSLASFPPPASGACGCRDDLWLDMIFGHLDVEVTVDDRKAYTRPWTIALRQRMVVDTELIDEICLENERSSPRMLATP